MQRHEMMTAMAELGLKGMAGAFDEAVTCSIASAVPIGSSRRRSTIGNSGLSRGVIGSATPPSA